MVPIVTIHKLSTSVCLLQLSGRQLQRALWRSTRNVSSRPPCLFICSIGALIEHVQHADEHACLKLFWFATDVDEQSKKEIKDILLAYDRTLLVADPRRCEPKKCASTE